MEKWVEDIQMAIDLAEKSSGPTPEFLASSPPDNKSPDEAAVADQESEDDLSASRTSLERQAPHRGNTMVHVCWHRNTSVSMVDFSVAVENQLSGTLLRKFKNSSGWQKLWVVFTNFCLFFYKSPQVSPGPRAGGREGGSLPPGGRRTAWWRPSPRDPGFQGTVDAVRVREEHCGLSEHGRGRTEVKAQGQSGPHWPGPPLHSPLLLTLPRTRTPWPASLCSATHSPFPQSRRTSTRTTCSSCISSPTCTTSGLKANIHLKGGWR